MILRSLELKAFGKFGEASHEFRRGLNLVVGPNEAGKSTLVEAIPAVLFGVRDKQRFRSWGRQGSSSCSLVFEHPGGSVRIRRSLGDDQVELEEFDPLYQPQQSFSGKVAPQGRSAERRVYLESLQRLIGFSDEALFRSTLFFGQGRLALAAGTSLATKLRQLLSGAVEIDYDQVLTSLSEDYFALTRINPWGKDKSLDRELEQQQARRAEIEAELARQLQALAEHAELEERIAELAASTESWQQELDRGERYLSWVKNRWHLEERRESLARELEQLSLQRQQVDGLLRQQQSLRQQLSDAGLPLPEDDEQEFPLAELRQLRVSQQGLQVEEQRLRRQLAAGTGGKPWAVGLVLLLGAGLIGAGSWWWPQGRIPLLAGGAALLLLCGLWSGRRVVRQRALQTRLLGRLGLIEEQQQTLQQQLARLDARLQPLGLSSEQILNEGFLQRWEQSRQLRRHLGETVASLKVLPAVQDLEARERELLRELAVADERYEQLRPLRSGVDLEPEDIPAAEQRMEKLRQTLAAGRAELPELQGRRQALAVIVQRNQLLAEEHAALEVQIAKLQQRVAALQLGHEVLSEVVAEFRGGYLARLATQAGRRLAPLTDGRYRELRFDDQLQVSLKSPQGSWQPLEQFSAGTRDAVQMVVRLALLDQLGAGRKLPLVIDDALVNLDQARQQKFLEMLEKLSLEHQIIVFSHDQKLLGRAARDRWHVIPLDNSNSRPEKEESHVGQLHLL